MGEHLYTLIIFLVPLNFWWSSTQPAMSKVDVGYCNLFNQEGHRKKIPLLKDIVTCISQLEKRNFLTL